MNNPLVSICVPVYNVEPFIKRCLISLFNQTYDNIEYIFVNDCTKDKSIKIINDIAEQFPLRLSQLQVVSNKANLGIAASRNIAISHSHGEFLIFVDPDDYVDIRMVQLFVENQKETKSDIVNAQNYHLFKKNNIKYDNYTSENPQKTAVLVFQRKLSGSVWGRMYRTDLFLENKIKCRDGVNMGEDLQLVCQAFYFAQKVSYIREPLYYYDCSRNTSYSNVYSKEKLNHDWASHDIVKDFFLRQDSSLKEETDKAELKLICTHFVYSARFKNISYYYDEAKRRLSFIDKKVWKSQPFHMRLFLWLSNYKWLMNPYVKISRGLKWIFINLRNR